MFQNMQQREKILLFAFLGVGILWFGYPIVESRFLTPVDQRNSQLTSLTKRYNQKKDEEKQLKSSEKKLKDWKSSSFPPNVLDAQLWYKDWLEDLAKISDVTTTSVKPGLRSRKGDIYTTVQVSIDGEATFPKLCTFLYHFHRADLLHRIFSLRIDSSEKRGNPPLKFKLTAEGLCMADAPLRRRLFPETTLAADLSPSGGEIQVRDTEGFPTKAGFRIRISTEYLTVTKIDGTKWTVERGVDTTSEISHVAKETVELAPINRKMKNTTLDDYREKLIAKSPFVVPTIYEPKISPIGEKTLVRGDVFKHKVLFSGFDPAEGDPVFRLTDDDSVGIKIDPDSREITWTPSKEQKAGKYRATISVNPSERPEDVLKHQFTIALVEPEKPLDDDAAQFTYFVGYVARGGEPEAWLYDRTTNRKLVLKEGTPFKFADIEAFVLTIGRKFVLMQIDGKTWRLDLGENLRSMKELVEESATTKPSGNTETVVTAQKPTVP